MPKKRNHARPAGTPLSVTPAGPVPRRLIAMPYPSPPSPRPPVPAPSPPPPEEMFCLVVRRDAPDGVWRFVHITPHGINLLDHPRQFFRQPSAAVRDLWNAIAVERAVGGIDEPIDSSSARFVRLRLVAEDATERLFTDRLELEQATRLAAVAKLTDAEARSLGIARERARLKLTLPAAGDHFSTFERAREEMEEMCFGSMEMSRPGGKQGKAGPKRRP